MRSTTGSNNRVLLELTGLKVDTANPQQVQEELRNRVTPLSHTEMEKVNLLEARDTMFHEGEEVEAISTFIEFFATE